MRIASGYIAENALPGQFVNIRSCEGINTLLRRPISILRVDRDKGAFDIVFQVRGKGTGMLAMKKAGDTVDIIGPLGKPFFINESFRKIAVVGGGIGIFPLLFLLKEMQSAEKTVFLGFRNKECIVLSDDFEKACDSLHIATDDGSAGRKGLVTGLLEESLDNGQTFDIIYACGPGPMLKKVAYLAKKHNIRCQVSLEQRMGCGIGACLVCACKTKQGDDWDYSHVCKDGPVFWSDQIIFDE
ncbi:MAG TPA: dihydroorotate dehydrogenase electron transfer subunit [Clostridiaceae bacterium]|nr:dihydroorotate dehydrogenase electron transfer subunit [Clostridiaceae bacterium]